MTGPDAARADAIGRLSRARAVLITTFKKDGTAVATPVWGYVDGEEFYFTTQATSGKVKRLRNNGRVLIAPSTQRGRSTSPAWTGTARLLDEAATDRVLRRKRRRYVLLRLPLGAINQNQIGVVVTVDAQS